MQSIVRSLPDKIYELDQNGIITFISWGLKKPKSELRGKHFLEFVAPENADFVVSRWEDAKQGIYTPYEIETVAKDGHKVNLMITTSPVIEPTITSWCKETSPSLRTWRRNYTAARSLRRWVSCPPGLPMKSAIRFHPSR